MTIDLSEGIDPSEWGPLPTNDRVQVGGTTVWTGPYDPPVLVAQPNRWGVVESQFPDVPCLVEIDPAVSGWLPMPEDVLGYVDRAHRRIEEPTAGAVGRRLMDDAEHLAKSLTQIRGVVVAARPFARTAPLITPLEAGLVVVRFQDHGLVGVRPLEQMAGAIALTVRDEHHPEDLRRVADVLAEILGEAE